MRTILPSIVAVVLLFAIIRVNSDNPMDVSGNEVALNWTQRAVGGLIAATAACALLLRGSANDTLERQFGLVLPLLGGMLLATSNWALAIAIGAIGVAPIFKTIFNGRGARPM